MFGAPWGRKRAFEKPILRHRVDAGRHQDRAQAPCFERVVEELETVAESIRLHPELNHNSAERLLKIASDIRKDAGLPECGTMPSVTS